MSQFDLYKNARGGSYPYLLDVQADLLARLATRAVVPLMTMKRYGAKPISRLNPTVRIANVEHILLVQELAAIPALELREKVTSLASRRTEIIDALDLLFMGL
jgi:toxin CcdB